MNLAIFSNVATIIGAAVTVVDLLMVLLRLRHIRAANVTAAWKVIEEKLQAEDVHVGRAICRQLNVTNKANLPRIEFPDDNGWKPILDALSSDFCQDKWFQDLVSAGDVGLPEVAHKLKTYVSKTYDAFDLAALIA